MEGTNQRRRDEPVPLRRAMQSAMADRGLTYRQLAAITKQQGAREGKGFTHAHLNGIARGDEPPSIPAMEAIAAALDLEPNMIIEYRLARFRQLFDERVVDGGVDRAWENYREFTRGLMLLASETATELERTAGTDAQPEATDAEVLSLLEARRRQSG